MRFNFRYKLLVVFMVFIGESCYAGFGHYMYYCVYKSTSSLESEVFIFNHSNEYCSHADGGESHIAIARGDKSGYYCTSKPDYVWIDTDGIPCAFNNSGMDMNVSSPSYDGGFVRLSWGKGTIWSKQSFWTENRNRDILTCRVSPGQCRGNDGGGTISFNIEFNSKMFVTYYPQELMRRGS